MVMSFANNEFPAEPVPSLSDVLTVNLVVDNTPVNLGLWDTTQAVYDRMSPLRYPQTDVFIFCYSATNPASFDSLEHKWLPEISYRCPGVPFLIVETKTDVLDDELIMESRAEKERPRYHQHIVSRKEGQRLANTLGAHGFMQCSAFAQEGLKEVFEEAIRAVLYPAMRAEPKSKSFLSSVFSFGRCQPQ